MPKIISRITSIFFILFVSTFTCHLAADDFSLDGAGSSAVGEVMQTWIKTYNQNKHVKINYHPVGSGLGLRYLENKKVDFAATDMPYDNAILNKRQWFQFPIAVSQVTIVYNLPNIHYALTLNGNIIAQMYMGEIKKWNNPQIQKINPHIKLPNKNIILAYRSNLSGTTYTLSHYLSEVSDVWASEYGSSLLFGKLPKTAVGTGSDRVLAQTVKQLPYSLGYTTTTYARAVQVAQSNLVNSAGRVVSPQKLFAYAALANIPTSRLLLNLADAPGIDSWPLIQTTFAVMPRHSEKAAAILSFFYWVLRDQAVVTDNLGYTPVPQVYINQITALWSQYYPQTMKKILAYENHR